MCLAKVLPAQQSKGKNRDSQLQTGVMQTCKNKNWILQFNLCTVML